MRETPPWKGESRQHGTMLWSETSAVSQYFLRHVQCATLINTGLEWFHVYLSSVVASVEALTIVAGWKGRFLFSVQRSCNRRTQDSLLEPHSHILLFCIGPQSNLWDICPGKGMFTVQLSTATASQLSVATTGRTKQLPLVLTEPFGILMSTSNTAALALYQQCEC